MKDEAGKKLRNLAPESGRPFKGAVVALQAGTKVVQVSHLAAPPKVQQAPKIHDRRRPPISFRVAQNCGTTAYFAAHRDTSTLAVFSWAENQAQPVLAKGVGVARWIGTNVRKRRRLPSGAPGRGWRHHCRRNSHSDYDVYR